MQDNLEFVQWLKRYWEANNSGEYYDAVARRKAAPGGAPPASASRVPPARTATRPPAPATRSTPKPTAAKPTSRGTSSASQTRPGVSSGGPIKSQTASPRRTPQQQSREVENLIAQLTDLSSSFDAMKSERDFYFDKLRDIEILTQKQSSMGFKEDPFVKQIQAVLYSTEVN
jgi:RP/EB family microtubule-associated protein